MNIKKNDNVQIIAGKDKGKSGKVLQVFPALNRASIEGANLLVKHMRGRKSGEKGQRIEFPAPITMSNLMLICPKCNKPTRVGHKVMAGAEGLRGSKVRICRKCQATID